LPKIVVEAGVECAVDLEECVEIAVTELAANISHAVCDHEQELERDLRLWHCGGTQQVERRSFVSSFRFSFSNVLR
jgi:hypothetical protein